MFNSAPSSPADGAPSAAATTDSDVVMTEATNEEPTTTNGSKKTSATEKKRTVEEIYKKKSQLEHILLRPDTYIGSTEAEEQEMWVFDTEEDLIKRRKIKYVPGLYKIVDEILVNAADNKVRNRIIIKKRIRVLIMK